LIIKKTLKFQGHQAEEYSNLESVTGPFGRDLITQARFPTISSSKIKVFDNATGAGAIVNFLYSTPYHDVEKEVLGGDISPAMIEQFKKRAKDNGWKGVRAEIIDAMVSINDPILLTKRNQIRLEYRIHNFLTMSLTMFSSISPYFRFQIPSGH
jgi:SAM-dependent methyltransferase